MYRISSLSQAMINRVLITLSAVALILILTADADATDRKRTRLELASTFHPEHPLFGKQLETLLTAVKAHSGSNIKIRRSRKTRGYSAVQAVQLLNANGLDGVLLDPVNLGYRPAIAQIFGGLPFGPEAADILTWAESSAGREQVNNAFNRLGLQAIPCGHGKLNSGVFSRDGFEWPAPAITVHTQGLAGEIYRSMNMAVQPLPRGDLYLGYASGVVDLLVTGNPPMDARAGYAQVSSHFYYPSWERNSAFALLLINLDRWQAYSESVQNSINAGCQQLNRLPATYDESTTLELISQQGTNNTVVQPWPPHFLQSARLYWEQSIPVLLDRHPSLAPAFNTLGVN